MVIFAHSVVGSTVNLEKSMSAKTKTPKDYHYTEKEMDESLERFDKMKPVSLNEIITESKVKYSETPKAA